MSRLLPPLIILAFVVTASPVSAAGAEREAGEILARAGVEAFDQGKYERALTKFEQALVVMYGGKIERASAQLLNYLGRSYAALNRCDEALPVLKRATSDDAPEAFEAAREDAETQCMVHQAKVTLSDKGCKRALPMLRSLAKRTKGDGEKWRIKALKRCDPQLPTLPSSVSGADAANTLLSAARKERRRHRYRRARVLYKKALAVVDDPMIRRELAEVQMKRRACKEGLKTLAPLSDAELNAELLNARTQCRRKLGLSTPSPSFPPPPAPLIPAKDAMSPMTLWGWVSIGSGAALGALGVTLAVMYSSATDDYTAQHALTLQNAPAGDWESRDSWTNAQPEVKDLRDTATSYSVGGFVSAGLAAAAIGTGIALLLMDSEPDSTSGVELRPLASPTQLGFSLSF